MAALVVVAGLGCGGGSSTGNTGGSAGSTGPGVGGAGPGSAGNGGTGNVGTGGGGAFTEPPGGGSTPLGDVTFPWKLFDGSVPDVPASTSGTTYYTDPVNGADSNAGTSFAAAKKTLNGALSKVKAGDTILMAGGVYRERPNVNSLSGNANAVITIGSYGHGTGRPILDGGVKPNAWTKYTAQGQTTVWQSSTGGLSDFNGAPVLGIYVNAGTKGEFALKEVVHGQLERYGGDTLPPNQNQTNLKDGTSNWYYDTAGKIVYADFGGTLGTADPNSADVSLIYSSANNHDPLITLTAGHDYLSFIGLAIRASSWHAVYAEASHLTFDHCDMKFNGGGGIFLAAGSASSNVTDNTVRETRIWMNVLDNYPRFNNANTGGGWPGALSWYSQSNALSEGNVVYQNGGEGLILWGTEGSGSNPHVSMNNRVYHNVIFDNWSVNLYLDNTQNARIEQNFVFNHPRNPAMTFDNILTTSNGYNQDYGKRLTPVNLSLADEPGSSFDGHAYLQNITVINNIFAGAKFGILDYDDGTTGVIHGLKGCIIANNTIILGEQAIPGQDGYGWRHGFGDMSADNNTIIQNNLMVVPTSADNFIDSPRANTTTGIMLNNNLYSGSGTFSGSNFTSWKSGHAGWDTASLNADAMLTDVTEFNQTVDARAVYDWKKAAPKAGSPALGAGADQSSRFTSDFTAGTRPAGSKDIGALLPQ